jgi:hypothetical protein
MALPIGAVAEIVPALAAAAVAQEGVSVGNVVRDIKGGAEILDALERLRQMPIHNQQMMDEMMKAVQNQQIQNQRVMQEMTEEW